MNEEQIEGWNQRLRELAPIEITRWAVAQAEGRAVVSTNFRPYEAVILHLCVQVQPDIPVLWVDHGYNRPATYKHAEELKRTLGLNVKGFVPRITASHRDAIYGPVPSTDDEANLKEFSAMMKLEPFERGMRELKPKIWITALRKTQNQNRAGMDIVTWDRKFEALKVSPVFYMSDLEMEAYVATFGLPNEWDYFDPAKADEKRECGLHVNATR